MICTDFELIKAALTQGNLIGLPTETVYGLAANAFNEEAISKIFELKGRPKSNPLIVHIGRVNQMFELISELPEPLKILSNLFWPGPLTLLIPKSERVSPLVTAGHSRIAIRMPNHPVALELLQQLDFPLVAPSANVSNRISPTESAHVEKYFPEIYTLEGGPCKAGLESTIVGMEGTSLNVYRWGSISRESIEDQVGKVLDRSGNAHQTIAPGMGKKHYAPKCPLVVTKEPAFILSISKGKRIGVIWFDKIAWESPDVLAHEILSSTQNLEEAARNIFQAMHRLESYDLDLIIAERLPEFGLGISINDRLDRASVN